MLWFLDLVWDDLSRKYTIAKAGKAVFFRVVRTADTHTTIIYPPPLSCRSGEAPLSSRLSSGGRGMELSDLESFQGGLYTCTVFFCVVLGMCVAYVARLFRRLAVV